MLDDDANDDMLIRMRMKVPMLVRMWMMMRVRRNSRTVFNKGGSTHDGVAETVMK